MKYYTIYPLDLGMITRDLSVMAHLQSPGVKKDYPILAWYIEGGGHRILVDTGGEPATGSNRMPYTQSQEQTLPYALQKLNVSPKDIDTVILTHLHWDHAGNNFLFPEAKFYVQRAELHHAIAPVSPQRNAYVISEIAKTRYEALEGDCELMEGISVILTPGHSAGSQTVLVNGKETTYALLGDFVSTIECFEASLPNALADAEAYDRGFKRLKAIPGLTPMPSHEIKLLEKKFYD